MRPSKRHGGYTLIELTAVVALVGTLSAVALPRYVEISRSARAVKLDMARSAVIGSAQSFHLKWMLAGSPAATTVIDGVQMNGAGYPTEAGILAAAGVEQGYDTHVAGVIATDPQHPDCSLAYTSSDGRTSMRDARGVHC